MPRTVGRTGNKQEKSEATVPLRSCGGTGWGLASQKGSGVPVDKWTIHQQGVRAATQVSGVLGCAGKRCQQVEERGCSFGSAPVHDRRWLVKGPGGAKGLEDLCVRRG